MEGQASSSGWFVVRDPEAVRLLDQAPWREVVHALLGRESTATQLARALGATLNATFVKLRRLERVGLVRVTREERRAGRAVKHYTAVSSHLFVPFEAMSLPDVEAVYLRDQHDQLRQFVHALLDTYRRAWGEPGTLGQSHYRDADGSTLSTFGPAPGTTWSSLASDHPATVLNGGTVFLTPSEAKALQRELYALHARYGQAGRDRRPYRLHVGLTPETSAEPQDADVGHGGDARPASPS